MGCPDWGVRVPIVLGYPGGFGVPTHFWGALLRMRLLVDLGDPIWGAIVDSGSPHTSGVPHLGWVPWWIWGTLFGVTLGIWGPHTLLGCPA